MTGGLRQYRQLADVVRDIMLFVRPDGRIVEANEAALAAYGYARRELLALSIFDLREPEDRPLVARQLAAANAGGVKFETVHRRKDGTRFPVEVISHGADIGGEELLLSVVRDVSDRKRAELALRESEERFRTIANAAPALIWLSDAENRRTWFNRPWLDFTGRSLEEEVGNGWMSGIHPDDADRYVALDDALFRGRLPVAQEYRLRGHDGEYRWLLEQGAPLYAPDGTFTGYVGSCVDITDRKQDEERRALLLAVSRLALESPDAGPALTEAVFDRIRGHLEADACFNYRVTADGSLRLETGIGIPDRARAAAARLRPGEAFCGTVAAAASPLAADAARIRTDPQGAFVRQLGIRAYSCHPLLGGGGRVLGTFSVGTARREAFSPREIEFLQTISHFLALAWERREAVEAVRAGEESLRLTLTGARAGVWEADLVTGEATWSPELYELMGLDPRRARAPTREEFFQLLHPDDRQPTRQAFDAATLRGGRFEHEFRVVRRDGTTIWLSAAGRVDLDEQGRPSRARGINQDVSQRKSAEEQLRLALAASQAGVWSWDVTADATTWSPENYELYGLDPARGAPRYADWGSRIHPDDHARVAQAVQDALEGRTAEYRVEFRIVHPERGVRWLIGLGRVDRAADGSPLRMSGINLDVTQRRETEARLQQAQRVQSVGRLAGGIAHEVNNLMTAVLGFGSFAMGELDPEHPAVGEIEQMVKAGERAAAITRQLLAFTRQQVLRPARLDLNAVVQELVPVLERLLGAEHQLVLRLDPGLGEVRADRGQLEQVLVNLALNSRDAMSGGGTVTVASEAAELDGDAVGRHPGIELKRGRYLQLSVSDTGTGMDEATRSRVFEPFFTTKPVGQGTGLGLSTVYGIVKQSDGYVWLYSEPGLGTTVKVYLPVVEAAAPIEESATPGPRVPNARGEIVLVAEDEPMVRSLARRTLELHGYRVMEAADGRTALELLERLGGGVDLVLSDAVMPELSGRALGEIIGARWPAIPVMYMSGYPGKEVVDRGLVSPDAPFVAKPFSPEALARRTREVLDAARSWPGRDPGRSR